MSLKEISEDMFDDLVLQPGKTVLADFWAPWCGPCRMMSAVLEEALPVIEQMGDIVKINVDEQPGLAARYGIMTIPTLIVFKNGEIHKRVVGVCSKEELSELFN